MELSHEFRVDVAVDRAWSMLTDIERIAPCMPGAELHEVEGDEYRGVVKVKVGPISAQYKGKATFVERDDGAHRAVVRAEGRETRGQGNANATITASLAPDGDGTRVSIVTDLTITGRVAQLGRGVLADVSGKLLTEFVSRLEADVLSANGSRDAERSAVPSAVADAVVESNRPAPPGDDAPQVRRIEQAPAEPVDLLGTAGVPVLKRLLPLAAALVVLSVLLRRRRRRRRKP